jgi:hypothetical protein
MYYKIMYIRLFIAFLYLVNCSMFGAAEAEKKSSDASSYIPVENVFNVFLDDINADTYALPVYDSYKEKEPQISDLVLVKQKNHWKLGVIVSKNGKDLFEVMLQKDKKHFHVTVSISSMRELYPLWSMIYKGTIITQFPEVFFTVIEQYSKMNCAKKNMVYGQLVQPGSHFIVIGDLHGDLDSLARNLTRISEQLKLLNRQGKFAHNTYLVLLGDYTDRGQLGCQCWYTLMRLALENPERVFLVRGNHETEKFSQLKKYYKSFYQEWESMFSQEQISTWWPEMLTIFENLMSGVLLGLRFVNYYDFIFLCHGGYASSWSPSYFIKMLINADKPLMTEVADDQAVALMNNDFIGLSSQNNMAEQKKLRLHKEGEHIDWQEMRKFLRDNGSAIDWQATYQYCLRSILRGHQHAEGGIVQLRPMDNPWRKLHHRQTYEVDQYSVYSFTSSPTNYGKEDAFGLLYAAPNGRWYLTPFIYPIKSK